MPRSVSQSVDRIDARIAFLGKTYGVLALAIGAGGLGAWLSMGLVFPHAHPWIMLALMIGGLLGVQAVRHVRGLNLVALLAFGALTGMAIAPLIGFVAAKGGFLVAEAFLTAATAFLALSAYVFLSRRDFSFLRGFVVTGLIGLIALGLLNAFVFESGPVALASAAVGTLLFSAFILFDTSNIVRTYPDDEYIAAALTLYLDVFLLFENLLVLFGMLGDEG